METNKLVQRVAQQLRDASRNLVHIEQNKTFQYIVEACRKELPIDFVAMAMANGTARTSPCIDAGGWQDQKILELRAQWPFHTKKLAPTLLRCEMLHGRFFPKSQNPQAQSTSDM